MTASDKETLARTAGLRDFRTPQLEDVERRRVQLWLLSLMVGCAIPVTIVVLQPELLPGGIGDIADLRTIRLVMVAMLVAVFGYVAERESTLRRLSRMLLDERVLTASLVSRVSELDLLLRASRAMNSSLRLEVVLELILTAAYDLLEAVDGCILLVRHDDAEHLEVAAVRGATTAIVGQRMPVDEGLTGQVVRKREPLLVVGEGQTSGPRVGSSLVVPLQIRDELVGMLNLSADPARKQFSEFDLRSVSVFAETAAAAINNARAHQRAQEQVNTLTQLDELKDEFLTMVTHELRTPLTALIGLAGTISKGAHSLPADQIEQLAEMARVQGWRLDRMVDDLLDSSNAERGALDLHPETVDAAKLVRTLTGTLQGGMNDHHVRLHLPDGPLTARVDPDAVSRILTNLVGNAVKYTPAGSTVTVTVAESPRGMALTVTDDGPGMPAEARSRAFDKFHRGPDAGRNAGLGLGLYLVRAIAEAHGGRASLLPAPDHGLQVRVELANIGDPELTPAV